MLALPLFLALLPSATLVLAHGPVDLFPRQSPAMPGIPAKCTGDCTPYFNQATACASASSFNECFCTLGKSASFETCVKCVGDASVASSARSMFNDACNGKGPLDGLGDSVASALSSVVSSATATVGGSASTPSSSDGTRNTGAASTGTSGNGAARVGAQDAVGAGMLLATAAAVGAVLMGF